MNSELIKALEKYRTGRNFQCKKWVDNKVKLFNEYLKTNKLSGAVLSVSGGVDSALTLALLKETMKLKDSNLKKLMVVSQPIHSSNWALERAQELCKKMEVELIVVDQTSYHSMLTEQITKAVGFEPNKFVTGQLRSYMRTPVNYYMAQLLTQEGFPAVVMGTGNQDEDGYLAYFCKAGDGVVDIQLIADLHKSEVFKVAEYLNVPESILVAKPSADLWEDQEDEKELEFTYDFIELVTGYYMKLDMNEQVMFYSSLSDKARKEFFELKDKCVAVHNRNKHKITGVVNL